MEAPTWTENRDGGRDTVVTRTYVLAVTRVMDGDNCVQVEVEAVAAAQRTTLYRRSEVSGYYI